MRLFVAVDPGERLRAALSTGHDARRDAVTARWVDPALLHVTLHFLGECTESEAALLRDALIDPAAAHREFRVETAGAGFFPGPSRPRVLFLRMESGGALESLAADVRAAAARCLPDREPETRPFRPHLTLARFRRPPDRGGLDLLPGLLPPDPPGFRVRDIRLVRSTLGSGGPSYADLAVFPLAPSR